MMDAENDRILGHLVGAGVLSTEEEAIVRAAAQTAAQARAEAPNILVCNKNYCLVVKD